MPKVQSALVRLRFHAPDPLPSSRAHFAAMVTAVFSRRRKTIENALLALRPDDRRGIAAGLEAAGIRPGLRPETLEIAELVRLSDALT